MNFIEELKKGLHTGFINFQKASTAEDDYKAFTEEYLKKVGDLNGK